ncbi:MAG: VWA domain-containing protein [Spirochaetaceae bacterium]|nr:VWA domain-containing protein [Spirochaetaceae bacterium]
MSFDNGRALFFLLFLIPLVLWAALYYRGRRRGLAAFLKALDAEEQRGFLEGDARSFWRSELFFLLFIACAIIALSGPRWGIRLVPEMRRGLDVIIALDVSRSMDAQDALPSRLRRAALVAGELVGTSDALRFGLALGRGRGVLAVPLTGDAEAVLNYLAVISSASATGSGTNLEDLLGAASGAFQDSLPSKRRIVLFSDGETLSGSLERAAEKLKSRDTALVAVGIGSEEGAVIPLNGGEFLTGGDGKPVMSVLRQGALRACAEKTGGVYIDGNREDAALLLKNHLDGLASEGLAGGVKRESRPRWQLFMIAGLCSLFLSRAGTRRRMRG